MLVPSLIFIYRINKLIDNSYERYSGSNYNDLLNDLGYNLIKSEPSYSKQANLFVIKK